MQGSDDYINKRPTGETNQDSDAEMSLLMVKIIKLMGNRAVRSAMAAIIAVGVTAGSIAQLDHMSHGSDSPDIFGKKNPHISSVVFTGDKENEIGVRVRYDPGVPRAEDNNLIQELDIKNPIEVKTPGGVYIKTDDINGDFYGLKAEDVKKAVENFNDKGDNDGIVWVSSQTTTTKNSDEK